MGISSECGCLRSPTDSKGPENKGKLIVVILPDTGERYLSTELFQN